MCHGFGGVYSLAERIGLEREHISYDIPGVNHFVWLTKFYYKGEDAFPVLDKWIEEQSPEFFKTCWASCHEGPKPVDLYKRFGAFPIGDTANPGGGCWGWWYHTDASTEKLWKEDAWTWYEGYFKGGTGHVKHMYDVARDKSADVSGIFVNKGMSNEPMIPLIEGLAVGPERTVIVNIQNDGEYVPGVPRDYEVEIAAVVSKKGVQGIRSEGLPKPILSHLLSDRVAPVEIELEAFRTGSRALLTDLIMMDPWTKSKDQAEKLIDTIFSLPYHKDMAAFYK
jgi:alpha-galactosidase